ncbi:T9SS type A sorting domain-containing protein [Polaribacter sp. M15]
MVDNSEININGFSKGLYLLKVVNDNQKVYLYKLIIN